METQATGADLAPVLRQALKPPVRDAGFWVVQAMVLLLAGLHFTVDIAAPAGTSAFPEGVPVALLIVPVGYAALRYGLAGSAATAIWATLLWLPDLALPHDHGHVGADLINLAIVDLTALFVGHHIEAERLARGRVEQANAERLNAEASYRRLFEANRSPILVLDAGGTVLEANPAARVVFGARAVGAPGASLLGRHDSLESLAGRVFTLEDERDYRVDVAPLAAGSPACQVILEDVTDELSEGRRATRYAALVIAAEESQRQRVARELHDEPLQLFLHLARRLENLGGSKGVPEQVSAGLREARTQALEAATRLRSLARDLRPPVLDQLGLVAALRSFLADVEEEADLVTSFRVNGTPGRAAPDVELGAFRIVQEAVRNTVRHAKAQQVSVSVTFRPDQLDLWVTDDGQGFVRDEIAELGSGHLGLVGMAERANLLGGVLTVEAAPGEGTIVSATLPSGDQAGASQP